MVDNKEGGQCWCIMNETCLNGRESWSWYAPSLSYSQSVHAKTWSSEHTVIVHSVLGLNNHAILLQIQN